MKKRPEVSLYYLVMTATNNAPGPEPKNSADQVKENKEKGTYWEDVAEQKMLRFVHAYEKEMMVAPSLSDLESNVANRRLDFVIENRDGIPQALVEVKSGKWTDFDQARDEIKLASEITERKLLIIATPADSLEGQFGPDFTAKLRSCADQHDVTLIHKRIGDLPGWEPVRNKLGSAINGAQVEEVPRSAPLFQRIEHSAQDLGRSTARSESSPTQISTMNAHTPPLRKAR